MDGIDSIEAHVWARMTKLCHTWPCFSPWNVWRLTLSEWLVFAETLDQIREEQQAAAIRPATW